jgi:hypothetical protein
VNRRTATPFGGFKLPELVSGVRDIHHTDSAALLFSGFG